MNPKLKSLLARLVLIGGMTGLVAYGSRALPHEQTLAVRLDNREVSQISAVITRVGDDEAAAGFSQNIVPPAPRILRHKFSAPNGTYIVVITVRDVSPIPAETSFERRVSLAGGEVIVSPE